MKAIDWIASGLNTLLGWIRQGIALLQGFLTIILQPVIDGVKACYDSNEKAVFFEVDGVVFSYHNISLSDTIQFLIRSAANKLIERPDIRLQKIPVELFDLALAS